MLSIKNISHKYQDTNGEVDAISNISFDADDGEYISIVGPSGCGKSTLLSIICGIIKPSSGEIFVSDEKLEGISPKIGYMLQKDNLLEWRTVYKNVIFGLEIRNMLNDENEEYAINLLKTYGLYEFKDKFPAQLSGGMRQRVALIRTLCAKPEILLLDEAFSALDYQTRLAVTDDVYRIIKNENKTTLMVTHDIPEAISMSDRVVVLTERPAKINEIVDINFNESGAIYPLERRKSPEFSRYFDEIWKELELRV